MSNLESYLSFTKPPPKAVATSQEIRDRGSIFVASIYHATDTAEVENAIKHVRNVVHGANPASHEMHAWRCMMLKNGKNGLGGPDDFEVKSGREDDGEKYGGVRILKGMESEAILDAVVIVSRWYGGNMLGPVRFTHIETCTREVCRAFKVVEEIESCIATLTELDDTLVRLRTELAEATASKDTSPLVDNDNSEPRLTSSQPLSKKRKLDYSDLLQPPDLPKAKRLLTARHKAVESVRRLILAQQKAKSKS